MGRLYASRAEGAGSILSQGTKNPTCHAVGPEKQKEKLCCYPRTTIYILGVNIPRWKNTVLVANWPPYREGKEKLRQEADRSRSVDGSFQKQENLWMRFVLGSQKINRNPQAAARILEVSTKLLAKFHHTSSPYGSTTHYCLKTVNLKTAPSMGTMGRTYIPKTKVGVRTLKMPGSSSQAIL